MTWHLATTVDASSHLSSSPAVSIDDGSADGSAGFPDQPSVMEIRLQAQEDEITLLKSSLADALRKLQVHDQVLHLLKQQLIAGNSPQLFTSCLASII